MSSGKLAIALAVLMTSPAWAQSNPGFVQGQTLTAAELNNGFSSKLDYIALGNSATLNVGTTAGTVAAGNDSRITSAASTGAANIFTFPQAVQLGAGSLPALSGAAWAISGADGTVGRYEAKAFANFGAFTGSRYDGTSASPTAVQAGDLIASFSAHAYDGTTLDGPIASIREYATDTITAAHWGSKICLATTPTNTATMTESLCQQPSGGITVGSPTGGDEGAGTINVLGNFYANGVLIPSSASPITWAATQTFSVAPVFTAQSGTRTALGLGTAATANTGTSGTGVIPTFDGAGAWTGIQSFTTRIVVTGAAGSFRNVFLETGTTGRWAFYADNAAESGSNAGSNFALNAYDDTGASLGSAFTVSRATQVMNFTRAPTFTDAPTTRTNLAVPGTGTANTFTGTQTISGDIKTAGTAPTLSSCGTSPTVTTGSTDTAGEITIGSASTSCTITYAATKTNAPFCIVVPKNSTTLPSMTIGTSTLVLTGVVATSVYEYHCVQH